MLSDRGIVTLWSDCGSSTCSDFMTAAHALYRSHGFVDAVPCRESEMPDEYKSHWVFMERRGVARQ